MKQPIFDAGVFCGNWPFHKVRTNTLAAVLAQQTENGIVGGLISAFEGIFYNDPTEADDELSSQLRQNAAYRPVMSVNPTLPSAAEDIARQLAHGAAAIRLYPCYHGYRLTDDCVKTVCALAAERGLPVFVTLRMEDDRNQYIFQPRALPAEEIAEFLGQTSAAVILSQVRQAELTALSREIAKPNVYADTAGLKDGLFAIERAVETVGAEKLLFASYAPMNALKSNLFTVTMDSLSEEDRCRILCKNAGKLFHIITDCAQ